MQHLVRDQIRRGVRAAVYRACWRRLEGDEAGAQAVLSCEVPAALGDHAEAPALDDELVRGWLDEDTADFDRAVLISDLVARRAGAAAPASAAASAPRPITPGSRALDDDGTRRQAAGSPAIADLLDGMLAQERRMRAAS